MGVRCYEVYDVRIVPFGARLCRYCFIPGGAFFAEVCSHVIVCRLHLEQFSACFGYLHGGFCLLV
jgi:hypothetical protein